MRLLFDTNVVLDVLLRRVPWLIDSRSCWDLVASGRVTGFVSASTLTDIYYLVRRQTGHAQARLAVVNCVATFAVAAVDGLHVVSALASPGPDFEDNLRIAVAARLGCDFIETRDLSDFASASVRPIHPAELAATLRGDA